MRTSFSVVGPGRYDGQTTLQGIRTRVRRNSETELHVESPGLDDYVRYPWEDPKK